jgi:hypothetical protein
MMLNKTWPFDVDAAAVCGIMRIRGEQTPPHQTMVPCTNTLKSALMPILYIYKQIECIWDEPTGACRDDDDSISARMLSVLIKTANPILGRLYMQIRVAFIVYQRLSILGAGLID